MGCARRCPGRPGGQMGLGGGGGCLVPRLRCLVVVPVVSARPHTHRRSGAARGCQRALDSPGPNPSPYTRRPPAPASPAPAREVRRQGNRDAARDSGGGEGVQPPEEQGGGEGRGKRKRRPDVCDGAAGAGVALGGVAPAVARQRLDGRLAVLAAQPLAEADLEDGRRRRRHVDDAGPVGQRREQSRLH